MFKHKTNLILIGIAAAVMVFLFAKHSSVTNIYSAQAQTVGAPDKPAMVQTTISKIDTANKVITIPKTKNGRDKIIYKDKIPVLAVSGKKLVPIKLSNLKTGNRVVIFVGFHPTRSEYYLGGLIIATNLQEKILKTAAAPSTPKKVVAKTAAKPTVKSAAVVKTAAKATNKPPTATLQQSNTTTPKPLPTTTPTPPAAKPTPPPAGGVIPTPTPTPVSTLASSGCGPLPAPTGATVIVSNWKELKTAVKNANENGGNITILLEDGDYAAEHFLFLMADKITVRGKSGDRDKVVIKSPKMRGGASHIFGIWGNNITVADMSIGRVANHVIQVFGEEEADNLLVHNVKFFDSYEQLLKVSVNNKKKEIKSENGIVECSLFEYTAGVGPQNYIGGIDAHNAVNWIVRNNTFKNIRSPNSTIAEYAIHFWNDSEGTLVEKNTIVNCDRGIGFGLDNSKHTNGIIRNNMIYHNATAGDVGIGLWNAPGSKVYNNTIFMENNYGAAIEYRFAGTSAEIYNNLTNKKIQKREGNPVGDLQNNFTNALAEWFVNPGAGNLRLAQRREELVEQGKIIESVKTDIDGQSRPQGNVYDIGADEWK